ncbi:hypothetical protein [Stigmatella erecta]|uniref:Uncharacterized protein n=1 Tax=Stigmatella erecta TaxID=83460 RepID=A0A1I0JI34_9BACT|nr:hypothetical protein [Stigmatella erecta]SEU09789.1 hypothetical protein SAMN05443639_107293 [Stigmatella erecta]
MSQAAAPAKTGTDLDSLEQMVNLPQRPAAVQWRKALRGRGGGLGPTDWQLIAVLEYPAAEAQALVSTLKPTGLAAPGLDDGGWLPEATRQSLKSAQAYDASAFYRPPLQEGTVLHVPGSSTFVLSLFTM